MKTCFNSVTAGRHQSIEEIIVACGQVGFEAIEIDEAHIRTFVEHQPIEELEAMIERAGLKVASVMPFDLAPFDETGLPFSRIKRGADDSKHLHASVLLTYCAAMVPEEMTLETARQKAADRAREYADAVAPLSIALEPIGRTTVMHGPRAALDIANRAGRDNVGIIMDSFHYYRSEITKEEILSIPAEKLLLVHLNDSEDKPRAELLDSHRLHVGKGILPLPEYLECLQAIGFQGFFSVEIFREEYWKEPVIDVVKEAKRTLDHALAAAGIH